MLNFTKWHYVHRKEWNGNQEGLTWEQTQQPVFSPSPTMCPLKPKFCLGGNIVPLLSHHDLVCGDSTLLWHRTQSLCLSVSHLPGKKASPDWSSCPDLPWVGKAGSPVGRGDRGQSKGTVTVEIQELLICSFSSARGELYFNLISFISAFFWEGF